ncbi:XdhC family protein [Planomonospora sp. ID67723]|uniref:XdhC family protein n=1 Tax=Planomonospora sp. ID67723 TaxID=2738134 RepID=UPI0018C3F729|nr:XdhC/CoxI family protein [Planomonospora sp. ID67723]MBG0829416.1 XdhC family protein [Planomonospora sp. ID67723]
MRELADDLLGWLEEGRAFAVASVIGTGGSAPRQPGAALAVNDEGEAVGSVSGGCVEGAVYELCREAIRTGEPVRHTFGYSDADAFTVGLTCGGIIEVLVWPVPPASPAAPVLAAALKAVRRGDPVAIVRTLDGAGPAGSAGDSTYPGTGVLAVFEDRVLGDVPGLTGESVTDVVAPEALAMLDAGLTGVRTLGCGDREITVFAETYAPPPRLLVFGAIDFAAALTRAGRFLGYHVTVCDARPVFATPRRFPDAHEVVVDWPHRYLARTRVDSRTVVCVLTHDAKFDVPLLEVALRLPVAYVGAMGSRRTHADRMARLRATGLSEGELARLRSPIGLDLGARTPEETALSIAAEFVALRRGGTGLPLTRTAGPIHPAGQTPPAGLTRLGVPGEAA